MGRDGDNRDKDGPGEQGKKGGRKGIVPPSPSKDEEPLTEGVVPPPPSKDEDPSKDKGSSKDKDDNKK